MLIFCYVPMRSGMVYPSPAEVRVQLELLKEWELWGWGQCWGWGRARKGVRVMSLLNCLQWKHRQLPRLLLFLQTTVKRGTTPYRALQALSSAVERGSTSAPPSSITCSDSSRLHLSSCQCWMQCKSKTKSQRPLSWWQLRNPAHRTWNVEQKQMHSATNVSLPTWTTWPSPLQWPYNCHQLR